MPTLLKISEKIRQSIYNVALPVELLKSYQENGLEPLTHGFAIRSNSANRYGLYFKREGKEIEYGLFYARLPFRHHPVRVTRIRTWKISNHIAPSEVTAALAITFFSFAKV